MKYKAAIIGCGKPNAVSEKQGFGIAYLHGQGYAGLGLPICAADIDNDNLGAFAERFQVKQAYTDYREMLAKEKPDFVSICTWPKLHKEMVMEAVKHGAKGIYCEKPIAFEYRDAKEMHDFCVRHGVVLNVGHQRRNGFEFIEAKRALQSGEIGKLLRMEAWVGDGWDLLSWGVHWVDILRFYNEGAEVSEVFAQTDIGNRTIRYQYPAEDRMLMQLLFSNGVLGLIHLTPYDLPVGNLLVGEEGVIRLTPEISDEVVVIGKRGRRTVRREEPFFAAFQRSLEGLVRSVESGQPNELDSSSTLINMQICMASYESARTRRTVRLPFEPERNPLGLLFEAGEREG